MGFGHEKLDVYRLSIGYVAWVYKKAGSLTGVHRSARDQWLRSSQSIPLNIAEGIGKTAAVFRDRAWLRFRMGGDPGCSGGREGAE